MDSSKISSSKSFNSASDQSCSTISTPPPSFVPPYSTAHASHQSHTSPTLSNGTTSITCMSSTSSLTNSNYKSRDELLANQNAPLIFERDVQSKSLEDLVHALHESNNGRNKGNHLAIENRPEFHSFLTDVVLDEPLSSNDRLKPFTVDTVAVKKMKAIKLI